MNYSQLKTYEELRDAVQNVGGGVSSVPMVDLRRIHGADRLGAIVRANIRDKLQSHGMAFCSADNTIPDSQSASIRVYIPGTPVGKLIQAVITVGEPHDKTIRRYADTQNSDRINRLREKFEEIREILEQHP